MHSSLLRPAALTAAALLALTACSDDGGGETGAAGAGGEDTGLLIVAPTDVYADLAQQVVGDSAEVEALVDSPAIDPHSYEASPQDRLLVEEADVVLANGGGYDSYMNQLADSAGIGEDVYQVIEGENEHSHDWDGEYANEHIWYDLQLMSEFALEFSEHMTELAPDNAEAYEENVQALSEEIDGLLERTRQIDAEGLSYFATEPVSQFLLLDAGFEDLTEEEFLNAVEHGEDVPARLYQDSLNLVTEGKADMLVYNPQTETQQSQHIREAAEDAGLPVLEFSETFPDDVDDFLIWMDENISQVEETVEELRG
ncbi:metal ABC transporter solute-binding protein, Zn/Mn family [Nesterenkonia cremea]|uniref:Metal ABC transporter substrate-binding protein n=1 Tax=Nesterenkonia cremea TaxID=1882340 RepID=A0A917API6_9MICC|nr:zinc ABC transporter substrate-binding protein [Nesterenkonia cremea]GGE61552.1 metal ABC transporter substrate-binding protein [Nesterenkonia cremea]